ncbi:MAG TPA: hypothetical protein VFQ61_07630, partial [Polyangiaceae bacterium]|nr:hypothetical protein [Polyangiaceae bacterium]
AVCPKSNAVKRAIQGVRERIARHGALPVPMKLRNAVTGLMRKEGYGSGYRYAHDFEGGYVPGETYLPEQLVGQRFYEPSSQGLEQSIRERLARLRGPRPSAQPPAASGAEPPRADTPSAEAQSAEAQSAEAQGVDAAAQPGPSTPTEEPRES